MALTTIDPNAALIVVDLQKGIVGAPFVHPIAGVIAHTRRLIDAFRSRGLTVVLVNVVGRAPGRTELQPQIGAVGQGWADLIPELGQQASDIVVTKRTWGAFANTDLDRQLKARDVTQAVVAGVATATGVEATARQAYEVGFNVALAIDAMTDRRAEAHDYSVRNVFPRLGETGASQAIIDLLQTRSA